MPKKKTTFADILKNAEQFPDDTEWQLADGMTVSLGDLREMFSGREKELSEAQKAATKREKDLETRSQQLETKVQEFATAWSEFQEQKKNLDLEAATRAAAGQPLQPWDWAKPDAYIEPVVQRINDALGKYGDQQKALEGLAKMFTDGIRWMARRDLQREFDGLPDRPEDLNIEGLYKYAMQEKVVDETGYPQFRKAYDRMMEPKRKEAHEKELEKKIRDKIQAEQVAQPPWMPRPNGTAGAANRERKNYGGDFDALFRDVLADPEVTSSINNLFNGGSS